MGRHCHRRNGIRLYAGKEIKGLWMQSIAPSMGFSFYNGKEGDRYVLVCVVSVLPGHQSACGVGDTGDWYSMESVL